MGPLDGRFDRLAELIATSPHNLVARRERPSVRTVHVPEVLAVGALLAPAPGERWLDLGTGGGLPGLVLAVQHADVAWTLLDATHKKTAAVTAIAAELGLDNVVVVTGRAEALAHEDRHRERYDGVVSRAVARLAVLAEYCRGFVRPGGCVAAIKGPNWHEELAEAASALAQLRLRHVSTTAVPTAVRPTTLVTMRAEGHTPTGFPRRVGVPSANPLGRS